jgi:hypothetical protein
MLPAYVHKGSITGSYVYAAIVSGSGIVEVVAAGVLIWLALPVLVALYGQSRGYPFFPLFVSGLVPGLGWALVLLAVTLAAGPQGRHCPTCHRLVPTGRTSCDGCNYDFVDRKVYAS